MAFNSFILKKKEMAVNFEIVLVFDIVVVIC